MAPRHSPGRFLAPGSAILAFGLLLAPGLAQNDGGKTKTSGNPPVREANGPGSKAATGSKDAKGTKTARGNTSRAAPLGIAVVDLDQATTAHPLFETRIKEHKEWARKQNLELDKLEKTIHAKQTQLKNTVQPGTPAAAKLRLEIETLRFKLNHWTKQLNSEGLAKRNRLLLELQTQVLDAIAELAPKQGIHLVLRRRAQPDRGPLRGLVQRAESTDVLYASQSLDITEDVIDFLKTKYPRK